MERRPRVEQWAQYYTMVWSRCTQAVVVDHRVAAHMAVDHKRTVDHTRTLHMAAEGTAVDHRVVVDHMAEGGRVEEDSLVGAGPGHKEEVGWDTTFFRVCRWLIEIPGKSLKIIEIN